MRTLGACDGCCEASIKYLILNSYKKFKIMVDRYATIMYYITRAKHKRAHNLIHAIVA